MVGRKEMKERAVRPRLLLRRSRRYLVKGVALCILMKLSSYLRYLSGDRLRLLLSYYRRRVGGSAVLRLLRCDPISGVSLLSPGLRASFGALSAL